jgi:hypothetical protein
MTRKIIAAIIFALLITGFVIVSFLVIISNRHPYIVEKKLKLGALLLSLSAVAVGCTEISCYVPALTDSFVIDQAIASSDSIVIKKSISDTITGKISERHSNTFSYAVFDTSDNIIFKENIYPIDGSFDEGIEEFKIDLGPAILPGKYDLRFYTEPQDSIKNTDWYGRSFSLTITD